MTALKTNQAHERCCLFRKSKLTCKDLNQNRSAIACFLVIRTSKQILCAAGQMARVSVRYKAILPADTPVKAPTYLIS